MVDLFYETWFLLYLKMFNALHTKKAPTIAGTFEKSYTQRDSSREAEIPLFRASSPLAIILSVQLSDLKM